MQLSVHVYDYIVRLYYPSEHNNALTSNIECVQWKEWNNYITPIALYCDMCIRNIAKAFMFLNHSVIYAHEFPMGVEVCLVCSE